MAGLCDVGPIVQMICARSSEMADFARKGAKFVCNPAGSGLQYPRPQQCLKRNRCPCPPISLSELRGQIERITYQSEETGFTIARLKVAGRKELVTVVGHIANPTPGEILSMKGEWGHHPKYGEQFKIVSCQSAVPATVYRDREIPRLGADQGARAGHGQADRRESSRKRPSTSSNTTSKSSPRSRGSAPNGSR